MILRLSGIECKDEHLTESPKILYYGVVAKMRYYKDLNGDYYYLEDSGRQVYDDKIVEHVKETVEATGPSVVGVGVAFSLSPDVKTLIDDMLQKLLADNQVMEDGIMARVDAFAHVSEESRLRMKVELKVEVKEEIPAQKDVWLLRLKH